MDQNCLCDWKIVLDLANGATCETTPAVFARWGAELVLIGDQPNGENINLGVGSEYPQLLGQAVLEHQANLGIAHDGDGDRLVVCDETGAVVDGDILLGLLALHGLRAGTLRNDTLVATIQSNLGLDHAVRDAGYDDAQIIEIVQHVALNTWTNYLNEVAQTEIDFPTVNADELAA